MDAQQPSPSSRDRLPLAITPAQIIALGLVAASIGWAGWLLRDRPTSEEVELLAGMALPSSEMAIMEAAFDRAQLTDHRNDGGRVWVPRSRQSAYMRALVDAEALPREFGGSLRRALEKNSPWQSRAVQGELLRVATQEELSLVICSMPGIERAAVLYDTESHHSLEGGGPAKTASVNVRTQPDMELDPARVQAIRVLVSASIAGLTPERVAVTDLRSGRVYAGPLESAEDREAAALAGADPALARKIAHEHHLTTKVRQSLAFLKGATVDVSVEFGPDDSEAAPLAPRPEEMHVAQPADMHATAPGPVQKSADANAPAEIRLRSAIIVASPPPAPAAAQPALRRAAEADTPESIHVSIAVPDSYFQSAFRAAEERAGQPVLQPMAIEAQETERIRRHVQSMLPATRDPTRRRVMVTSFPVASNSSARRESAVRGTAVSRSSAASAALATAERTAPAPLTADAVVAAVVGGRLSEIPRQVWLAATSICVGLLAGFLWWAGGRRDPSLVGRVSRQGLQQPRIDWSGAGETHATDAAASGALPGQSSSRFGIGRAAALILAVCACGAPVLAAATAFNRRRASVLPPDVFEVLGEGSLGGQHAVRIVRFGPKTLLVGVSAAGCQTLAELTDPQATACIAAACRGVHPPIRLAASSRSITPQSLPATAARTGGEAA